MTRGALLTLVFIGLTACTDLHTNQGPSLVDEDEYGDPLTVMDKSRALSCESRWHVNVHSPNAESIPYHRATRCTGRATLGARRFAAFITAHFGEQLEQGRPHGPVEIYNCRPIRGGEAYSVHSEGRAVDIYIPRQNGRANNRLGDQVANWLTANAAYIGIQYIIWDRTSWKGSRSTQSRCYTGQHPHDDHIHVELTWPAGRAETDFFRDIAAGAVQPPSPMSSPISPPLESARHWLGSPCRVDTDCGQLATGERPQCLPLLDNDADTAICTISCDGVCPDRQGAAPTFCIASAAQAGLGLCVAKAHGTNQHCAAWPNFVSHSTDRYVDRSHATAQRATVCVPAAWPQRQIDAQRHGDTHTDHVHSDNAPASRHAETSSDITDQPAENEGQTDHEGDANANSESPSLVAEHQDDSGVDDTEMHASEQISVCEDPALEMSDNDAPCPDVAHNTWRCACSIRYEVPVSQVCRGGVWINYDLYPQDCNRCDGRYTDGCDPN